MVAVLTDNCPRADRARADRASVRSWDDRPPLRLVVAPEVRRPAARRTSAAVTTRRSSLTTVLGLGLAAACAVLLAVFALQAALGGGGGGPLTTASASAGAPRPASARSWVVRPGDTLWSIATALQPHGDVRPLVDRLSAEVHGQALQVGQRLALP